MPAAHKRELSEANALVSRMCTLLRTGWAVGSQFAVENPIDRGDRALHRAFLDDTHGSIWCMPEIQKLELDCGGARVHFSQCMFGAKWQKQTTLMYTAGFEKWLGALRTLQCTHTTHESDAGGQRDEVTKSWNSREAAAFPPQMNYYLARAFSSLKFVESAAPIAPAPAAPAASAVPAPAVATAPPAEAAADAAAVAPPDVTASPAAEDPPELSPDSPRVPDTEPVAVRRKYQRHPVTYRSGESLTSVTRQGVRAGRALLLLSNAVLCLSKFNNGPDGRALLAGAAPQVDPRNRVEALAMDRPGWTTSMDAEMENHNQNGSFEWVRRCDVPKGRHLIKLVWVFKIKRNGKLKSRLCVQGCAQTAGIDFDQTFSAALRSSSLRFIASVSAREHLRLRRWDFVSAYLQGQLEEGEVVYCYSPPGYERRDSEGHEMCCKVVKPIYGMAQAGRRWQRSLFPWLTEHGFVQSEADPCLFHKSRGDDRLIVGVYVDDLCCAFKSDEPGSLYQEFVSSLADWNVEDEGELSDLLGVDFSVRNGQVSLRQTNYILKMYQDYLPDSPSTDSCHLPYGTDLPQLVIDGLVQEATDVDSDLLKRYQSLVGALLYCATNTRPDVAYAVALLCRAMGKPTPELYVAATRVLRYLHRTRDLGLTYEASPRDLHGYTDSDWAVKHSTSGWVFMMNQAAISWGSKKHANTCIESKHPQIREQTPPLPAARTYVWDVTMMVAFITHAHT